MNKWVGYRRPVKKWAQCNSWVPYSLPRCFFLWQTCLCVFARLFLCVCLFICRCRAASQWCLSAQGLQLLQFSVLWWVLFAAEQWWTICLSRKLIHLAGNFSRPFQGSQEQSLPCHCHQTNPIKERQWLCNREHWAHKEGGSIFGCTTPGWCWRRPGQWKPASPNPVVLDYNCQPSPLSWPFACRLCMTGVAIKHFLSTCGILVETIVNLADIWAWLIFPVSDTLPTTVIEELGL